MKTNICSFLAGNKRYASRVVAFLLSFLIIEMVSISISSNDTYAAYSASITTSGVVTVDVSSAGNGANVGTDNVVVNSSCPLGYTLSIANSETNGDNKLYRNGDNTSTSYISPTTGTKSNPKSIIGNDNLNTWGYSVAENVTTTSGFIGLTNERTVIKESSSASDTTSGDTIPVHYGVSVAPDLETGIYKMSGTNTITYYLTAPAECSSYTVVYNGNNATGSSAMSVNHTNIQEDGTIDLYASNYRRDGYGFAGWSTEQINPDAANAATLIANAASNNKIYGPNATITTDAAFIANADSNNIITLYAVWIKPTTDPSTNQPMTLQNWTGCSSMNNGDIIALKDQRDNNAYAVAKLADGNCWMVENLRLDNTNSDNATGALAQGYGGQFVGLASPEAVSLFDANVTTANSLYSTDGSGGTINLGATNANKRFPRFNNDNTASVSLDMTSSNTNVYSYGNYYNWAATIANTDNITSSGDYNTTSLCPTGWSIPRGGNKSREATNDYWNLIVTGLNGGINPANYESSSQPSYRGEIEAASIINKLEAFPNNFINSGHIDSGVVRVRGTNGMYWSSTSYSASSVYYLDFGYGTSIELVWPGTYSSLSRPDGKSVRCISSKSYVVSFNANGGSGSMSDQTAFVNNSTMLDANTFVAPTNRQFAGWNTAADGSGTSYTDQQSVINLANAGGTIILYAQWGCPGGKICYDANGADAGTMGNQTVSSSDTNITLLASNYSRSGYGFAGWSTSVDGTGTLYGPQEDLTLTAGQYASQGLQLYAIWIESEGSLQDSAKVSSVCNRLTQSGPSVPKTLNSVSALTDQRDNQTYAIAKLADGNCWMIENLRLEAENSTNELLAQGFGKSSTYGNFEGLATAESSNFTATNGATDATAANSKYYAGTQEGTATIDISQTNYAGYRMPRYNNTNTSARATSPTTNSNTSIYSYGNYYTWSAAMANTIYYSGPTATDADGKTSETVNTSLCPAGWRLPRGGNKSRQSTNDLWSLVVTGVNSEVNPANYDSSSSPYYNGTTEAGPVAKKLRSFPNNFLYSGYFGTYSASSRGSYGRYWSSTAYTYGSSHNLFFTSSSVYPGTGYSGTCSGYSIRCVVGS